MPQEPDQLNFATLAQSTLSAFLIQSFPFAALRQAILAVASALTSDRFVSFSNPAALTAFTQAGCPSTVS